MSLNITDTQKKQFGELYVDLAHAAPALLRDKGVELYFKQIEFIGEQYFKDGLVTQIPHVVMHDVKTLPQGGIAFIEANNAANGDGPGHAVIHLAGRADEKVLDAALEDALKRHIEMLIVPDNRWQKSISESDLKLPEKRID